MYSETMTLWCWILTLSKINDMNVTFNRCSDSDRVIKDENIENDSVTARDNTTEPKNPGNKRHHDSFSL